MYVQRRGVKVGLRQPRAPFEIPFLAYKRDWLSPLHSINILVVQESNSFQLLMCSFSSLV